MRKCLWRKESRTKKRLPRNWCGFHAVHLWTCCNEYLKHERKEKERAMTIGQMVTCNRCGQELTKPEPIKGARVLIGSAVSAVMDGHTGRVDLCPICVEYFKEWWEACDEQLDAKAKSNADRNERAKRKLLRDLNGQLWHRAKAAKDSAINAKQAADDTFRLINEIEEASK